ncbi:MAG: class I SAM-dependent methyltransferase [bacterium]|nr:class I SAM-dependent methyltransferase [bacterium]
MEMFNLNQEYAYLEETNEGILKFFNSLPLKSGLVLDAGCGRGILGEKIKTLGFTVWGIENNPIALQAAQKNIDHVIAADITDITKLDDELKNKQFDYIIFSDILEHIADPLMLLKNYRKFCHAHTNVLVSLPNVANWQIRLSLLLGQFNYKDSGVMDRTHLRFFTFKTAKCLLTEAGYTINQIDFTPYIVRSLLPLIKTLSKKEGTSAISDSKSFHFYMKYIYPVEYYFSYLWKTLFAFRIILIAQPDKK